MAAWTMRFSGRGGEPLAALRKNPAVRTAAGYGGYLLLGLAMGAGRLFSGCGPFGLAAVAAAGAALPGLFCFLGACGGYLIAGGLFSGIRYIATLFLIFTVGFITRPSRIGEKRWFMPAVASLMTGLTGLLYLEVEIGGVPGLMRVFLEVVLSGGCAYLFGFILKPERLTSEAAELRRGIGAAVMCACGLMGLASIRLWDVLSIGRFLASLGVMAAGFCGGPLTGCAAGAAMGLGMDMGGSPGLFFTAAYALAGLAAGGMYRWGRLTFAVSFCAANAVAVLLGWSSGARIPALYECFAASVIFMLLPQAAFTPVGTLLRVGRGQGETAYRLYQADRLDRLAGGFRRLYKASARGTRDHSPAMEATAVFDRAADVVCRGCVNKELCWRTEREDTVQGLTSMAEGMTRRGTVSVNDLPVAFRQRCVMPAAFAGAVNGELRGAAYRRQFAARLREGRAAAYGQFLDMAEVMADAARQLSGPAGPDVQLERRLIRYLKVRELDGVCSAFRDGRGRLHISLEGAGVESICGETDYLEKLSEAAGVRLCLTAAGEKGRVRLRQAEPLAVSVGIASLKKEGEPVSGDRGTYFKTESGLMCVILSDGMGTGKAAAGESADVVSILEELLKAGMEPACAMRLLNSSAMLKNGEDWGYATVDLCCIDLFSGETAFYKYGAAPSYVKTGRTIRRLRCDSLAAGMLSGEESAPDMVRIRLRPGHVALIASDGVLAEREDRWLRDILAGSDGMDTKTIARETLKAAAARFGAADDMTALAVRVEARQ